MRLLHPKTIELLAGVKLKLPLAHAWSEVFKMYASGQKHPKMFLKQDKDYGAYLAVLYKHATDIGCNFDREKVKSLPLYTKLAFNYSIDSKATKMDAEVLQALYFDSNYLFSDACSLYYKGINIFPGIFGSDWRKYVPVESHKEILRQVSKTVNKQSDEL